MEKLTDKSLMPFGQHKGKKMANVPASYLIYMVETFPLDIQGGPEVRQYVEDNIDALRLEVKKMGKDAKPTMR